MLAVPAHLHTIREPERVSSPYKYDVCVCVNKYVVLLHVCYCDTKKSCNTRGAAAAAFVWLQNQQVCAGTVQPAAAVTDALHARRDYCTTTTTTQLSRALTEVHDVRRGVFVCVFCIVSRACAHLVTLANVQMLCAYVLLPELLQSLCNCNCYI